MNSFVKSINSQKTVTTNGMPALTGTGSRCLDYFYQAGALRGKDPVPYFLAAFLEDRDLAVRILQWSRDPRTGAGERETFRQVLVFLEEQYPEVCERLIAKIPAIGRWDDLLVFKSNTMQTAAFKQIYQALRDGNQLCAKWVPRKGHTAEKLRQFLGLSPKEYRKKLVSLTKVVESQMCLNKWDEIDFNQVPSQAGRIYREAFNRHTPKYKEYVEGLKTGENKVNAGAIFPHDVIKELMGHRYGSLKPSQAAIDHAIQQWNNLPNWVGDHNVLPLVDVSGSMDTATVKGSRVTCLDVAVGLGLYIADHNRGAFKDVFMTFSEIPQIVKLSGNIAQKLNQMNSSSWGMNTNIYKAFVKILELALQNRVPQEDMPKMLLILSDMQFDSCVTECDTLTSLNWIFQQHGYAPPKVVFWNLNSHSNVPVSSHSTGAALISGFSPAVLKSVVSASPEEFTPQSIMAKTVMVPQYDW